jgi:hypothetical protein
MVRAVSVHCKELGKLDFLTQNSKVFFLVFKLSLKSSTYIRSPYGFPSSTATPSRHRKRGRRVGGRSGRRRLRPPPQPPFLRPPPPLHHLSPRPFPPAHPWPRLRCPGRDAPPLALIFRPRGSRGRPSRRRHRLPA